MAENGIFTISLDFELFWGVRDHRSLTSYRQNIENVHLVIPRLLELFTRYNIHCTWATVGFIFCEDQQELLKNIPAGIPDYLNRCFDQYEYIQNAILDKKYHFAPDLIELIAQTGGQEVGTHTFSHYYTLEIGADIRSFEYDVLQAKKAAEKSGIQLKSIVFPRNQYNAEFLQCCLKNGINTYRGTEKSWLYQTRSRTDEKILRRMLRLIDAYFNLSGHNTFKPGSCKEANNMWNIPSSRFLRPYSARLNLLDQLKLHRIKNSMSYAAQNNEIYHLWWHPHNFGANMDENFAFLESIFEYYKKLQARNNFLSLNLSEIRNKYG